MKSIRTTALKSSLFFSGVLALTSFVSATSHAQIPQPAIVAAPIENVYIPSGFDSNDNVQIVVEAQLLDTCHRRGPTPTATIDAEHHTITVNFPVYKYSGSFCATIVTNAHETLNLGTLPPGHYTVRVQRANENQHSEDYPLVDAGRFYVGPAISADPDSALYADVANVHVRPIRVVQVGNRRRTIYAAFITANQRKTCINIGRLGLSGSPQSNVIELLPVMNIEGDINAPTCRNTTNQMTYHIELPSFVVGRKLIHVRSMNGQAHNLIHDFPQQ